MSAKPLFVPTFCTGGATVEPSAGKKVSGWAPAERPPGQEMNWLAKFAGEWCQYLSDGALTGTHTFSGGSGVTFDTTAATFNAGLVLAANQHAIASGTGRYKHGARVLGVSAINAHVDNSVISSQLFASPCFRSTFGGAGEVLLPIHLESGKRITTAVVYYDVFATAAAITPRVGKVNITTGVVTLIVSGTADNTSSGIESQTLTVNTTLADNEQFFIRYTVTSANQRIYGAVVNYTEP